MSEWTPGARVRHPTFGDGTVLAANEQHITIHFDIVGRKKLAAGMAVLSPSSTSDPASVQRHSPRPASRPGGERTTPGVAAPSPGSHGPIAGNTSVPSSIDELIDLARRKVGSEESLLAFVSAMRGALPWRGQPHVGTLSGMRVMQFQNWLLDENPRWQMTDAQLLAVMRVEFPLATGLVHTGDADTGLSQIAGIRAQYNRDGHGGPSPAERGLPYSVSYGTY